MTPARLSLRFPAVRAADDLTPVIELFHRCIQRGLVEGLLIDVADYRHVPQGPGVLLVGHDVDYGVEADGFAVVRKRCEDAAAIQLRDALRMGLGALDALADDGALPVEVDRDRFTVEVRDRRLGDRDEVASVLADEVTPTLQELFGEDVTVAAVAGDPRDPAQVSVTVPAGSSVTALERLGGANPPLQSPWDITVEELASLRERDELVLVDVREESEYEVANLGGRNIPLASLAGRLDELDPSQKVVVHCRAGGRGAAAVQQLREAGFEDAWNVNGALVAWRERVDPSMPVL